MSITHSTVVVIADDGTSPVGTNEWNADHTVTNIAAVGGTVTTSTPVFDGAQTWNASGITFTGYKLNITNTASAAGSLLMDLQLGGTSIFSVDKTAVSELKNGTSAATLRAYNTFTDASNFERGVFDWTTTANALTIGTQKAGTGSNREVRLVSANLGTFLRTSNFAAIFDAAGGMDTVAPSVAASMNLGGATNTWLHVYTEDLRLSQSADVTLSRVASKVLQIGDTAQNAAGWMQWAGQARITADVTFTSNTTLGALATLSVNLQAGRTYIFEAELPFTCIAAAGAKAAIVATGGLTATNIIYDGWIVDSGANGIKGNTQATALGTAVANAAITGTAGHITIKGTITVNVAGTLNVQGAQSVTNATGTVFKRGGYLLVHDVA